MRTSRQILITPQENIQDPCTCEPLNLTWKGKDDKLYQDSLNIVWLVRPPLIVAMSGLQCHRGRPDGGKQITEKIPLPTREEVNQHQQQDGLPKTYQETSMQPQIQ